jgi:hypothetical protein
MIVAFNSLLLALDRLKPAAIYTLWGLPIGMNSIGFQADGKRIKSKK